MFRRLRHKLLLFLQVGIFASGVVAWLLQPEAWPAVLVCTLGASLVALLCGRVARHYLQSSLGRLRRIADDIGHGRPVATLDVQPGDDMYKLNTAINVLATQLAEASKKEKQLHEELRRHERLAFLGELAATVAHEVNNPLDGVQNCSRILRRSLDDRQRTVEMLDLIDNGVGRIELIVRRLLTLAREHVIRPRRARVVDVVEGAVALVANKLESRRVALVREYAAPEVEAQVDRPLLEQVFVNLMMNALDSMPDGGTLTLGIRRVPADGAADEAEVCVDVHDTGSGIPAEVLPHIFEPFFTTKTGGKGTGLGLAVAARIVDAHNGQLTVQTQDVDGDMQGTTFTMHVPVVPPAPAKRKAPGAAATVARDA
jgi:signal transduction histidine kinase